MYQYVTTEKGTSNLGTSTLRILRDTAGNITLVGSFQRAADAQNIYGTVTMKKKDHKQFSSKWGYRQE